jgi:transporter family-2 protein
MGLVRRKINSLRIGGTALAIAGLIITSEPATYDISWLLVLPFLAGSGTGFQQALNARLGQVAESPIVATFVNFVTGTALILVTTLLAQGGIDLPAAFPGNPLLYIGGIIGVTFIFTQVIVVPKIGALATSIALLFGQLGGSLLLDVIAPVAARGISVSTLIGIGLVSVGATLVLLRR